MKLGPEDRQTAIYCLRIAAARFDEDAKAMKESGLAKKAVERLVQQLTQQAEDARDLATRIEESDE